jgi:predicted glycosyl hydrolase (DUF1957 family)
MTVSFFIFFSISFSYLFLLSMYEHVRATSIYFTISLSRTSLH